MTITRADFLSKAISTPTIDHKLPDGDVVSLRRLTPKIYRNYKRSLRDADGLPLPERQAFSDELLVGRILCESPGNILMFNDREVLEGAFDEMPMAIIASLISRAYEMLGVTEVDEDREKNLSTTDSTEQS